MTTPEPSAPRANRRGDLTRRRLLDAAFRVARDSGSNAVTLEAVAAEAGTSKGGLLYHFPSKDSLLRAMVDDTLDRFHGITDEQRARDDGGPGGAPRAYVRGSFREDEDGMNRWSALLAAFFADPSLADGWRERAATWSQVDAENGGDVVNALVARLAADGLWIRELIGVSTVSAKHRRALERRLVELTREGAR